MSQYLLTNPLSLFNQNSGMSSFLINDKVSEVKHAKYSLNGWNGMPLKPVYKTVKKEPFKIHLNDIMSYNIS